MYEIDIALRAKCIWHVYIELPIDYTAYTRYYSVQLLLLGIKRLLLVNDGT